MGSETRIYSTILPSGNNWPCRGIEHHKLPPEPHRARVGGAVLLLATSLQTLNLWMPSSRQMSPLSSLRSFPILFSAIMKSDPSAPTPLPQLISLSLTPFSAEAVVDERLAHRPDVYLLALTQFATRADTVEVVGRQCSSLSLSFFMSSIK